MLLIVAALLIGGDALPRNLRAHVRFGRAVVVAHKQGCCGISSCLTRKPQEERP